MPRQHQHLGVFRQMRARKQYRGRLVDRNLPALSGAIEKALGKKAKVNRLPEQPGDMPLTCADVSKARKLLGYDPKTKFEDGLPKFVDWFLKSRAAK